MFAWLFRNKRRAQPASSPPLSPDPYAPLSKSEAVGNPYVRVIGKRPELAAPYEKRRDDDPGFDTTGFVLGYATGVPISPSHGISAGAMLGAAMHQSATPAHAAPDPAPSTSCDTSSSSSSSYDSSSSPSCDSGGSSGGSDSGSF